MVGVGHTLGGVDGAGRGAAVLVGAGTPGRGPQCVGTGLGRAFVGDGTGRAFVGDATGFGVVCGATGRGLADRTPGGEAGRAFFGGAGAGVRVDGRADVQGRAGDAGGTGAGVVVRTGAPVAPCASAFRSATVLTCGDEPEPAAAQIPAASAPAPAAPASASIGPRRMRPLSIMLLLGGTVSVHP
ncbi:MAG TPA: hypothetical protein VFV01_16500 [Spirillospora sp.]|nr:hypothetical protein [Spirillospora sp.]